MSCALCHKDHDPLEHVVSVKTMKLYETPEVLEARGRLTDALHAMHVDNRILVNARLASELDAAWDAYDAAVIDAAQRAVSL